MHKQEHNQAPFPINAFDIVPRGYTESMVAQSFFVFYYWTRCSPVSKFMETLDQLKRSSSGVVFSADVVGPPRERLGGGSRQRSDSTAMRRPQILFCASGQASASKQQHLMKYTHDRSIQSSIEASQKMMYDDLRASGPHAAGKPGTSDYN